MAINKLERRRWQHDTVENRVGVARFCEKLDETANLQEDQDEMLHH
jgi:hypothetical protein